MYVTLHIAQIWHFLDVSAPFCCRLGNDSAYLEVREGNEAAVRLYSRAGFIEDGRRRQYYDNGDAAILMSKTL